MSDVWDSSKDVFRGDRIRKFDIEQKRKQNEIERQRQLNYEIKMINEKRQRSFKNRLKRFFVGQNIGGKTTGFALLRKDLNPFKRR